MNRGLKMSRKLRVALIGAGMISRHHLLAWQGLAETAEVVAIYDPKRENAEARAREFAIPFVCTEAAALFSGPDLDAVDIASPRATHAGWILGAARRGLSVLCQKPLTPTLAEAEALRAALPPNARVMVHENWRFRPWYREALRWIEEGAIGELLLARMSLLSAAMLPDAGGSSPAFRRQPFMAREDRLMVAEVLIHHLDVLRRLCGGLRVVAARTLRSRAEIAGETVAEILLETAKGRPVTVTGTMAAPGLSPRAGDRLEIIGDCGSIIFDDWRLSLSGSCAREIAFEADLGYQGSFDALTAHFVAALRDGAPFETDLADNMETLRLVEHAYWAAGQRGRLPVAGRGEPK